MKVLLTGIMEMPRHAMKDRFKRYGIKVANTTSKSLDYIVTGTAPGAVKIDFARRHGITVLNEEDFFKMLYEKHPEYLL